MTSTIKAGDRIPSVPVKLVDASGVSDTTSDQILGEGHVVFFTVPGAFTPTCHTNHLPGFIANASKLRAAGISRIVCGSVNDHHVMKAWATATDALGSIDFLADGNGLLAKTMGLDSDKTSSGMGTRFVRSALLINNGVVETVFAEDVSGQVTGSGAPAILMALEASRV
jgi:peroxiredoxin